MRDEYEKIEDAADDMLLKLVQSPYTAAIIAAVAIAGVIALLAVAA